MLRKYHVVFAKIVKYISARWMWLLNSGNRMDDKEWFSYGENVTINSPLVLDGCDKISVGNDVYICNGLRLQIYDRKLGDNADFMNCENPVVVIGDGCYFCYNLSILAKERVYIGRDVLIASNVLISSESHGINPESDVPYKWQSLSGGEVVIGDGCWIGEKVVVLPGVHIGKKCVIGAGSVVTKSVPDFCIVVGNPARVVKKYDFDMHEWIKV